MASAQHAHAKKNLTKDEFLLFSQSFPKEAHKLSRRRLNLAVLKAERLMRKYGSSKNRQDPKRAKIIEFRMKTLAQVRKRFSKTLDRIDHVRKARIKKAKKSLTAQRKMKVELKDDARNGFIYREQKKMYANDTKLPRQHASAGRNMSKRIAGYMKARTRKGQVARDRITSAKEE